MDSARDLREPAAAALADDFLARFEETAMFYTNATFPPRTNPPRPDWAGSWDPVTDATFDTGIVALDAKTVGLMWFEDED